MSDITQWENGLVNIPLNSPLVESLDQVGREGWKPWAVMGADDKNIRIAVVREKRAITLATQMPNGIINN